MVSHFIKRNNQVHSQSFSVRHARQRHFLKLWHHHQEMELVYILKGKGMRFVGDSIEPFYSGDFVLLGDELPHKWQNDPEYFKSKDLEAEAIIIHFEKDFLANALQDTIELRPIGELLSAADRGIRFKGKVNREMPHLLKQILKTPPGLNRFLQLLNILRLLTNEKAYTFITSPGYSNSVYEKDVKLKKVKDYVMNNFQTAISLKDIADEVSMNKAAFCRYFKNSTSMTFSAYLNEIRIGYACKLLQANTQDTIAKICFESGFNNLSNFNIRFKEVIGRTPTEYIKLTR